MKVDGISNGWYRFDGDKWVAGNYLIAGTPVESKPSPTSTPSKSKPKITPKLSITVNHTGRQVLIDKGVSPVNF